MLLEKNDQALARIGFLYAIYRIAISVVLFAIIIITRLEESFTASNVVLISIIISYFTISNLQLFSFIAIAKKRLQILLFSIFDFISFCFITWHLGYLETQIAFLFILPVFIMSLTQKRQNSFLITLLVILFILALPTYNVVSGRSDFTLFNFLNSINLSAVFLIINISTIFYSKKFNKLLNISESKTNEAKRFREIGREIVSGINVGYIVLNSFGEIELMNNMANSIFKNKKQPKTLKDLNDDCDLKLKEMRKLFKEAGNFNVNINGQYYLICFKPLTNEDLLLLTIEDIRTINNRVQHLKLMELGQLSASISHEIRNPLSIIGQANELILSESNLTEYCGIIDKQINRIDLIIESTLNMAKSGSFNPTKIKVFDFMSQLLSESLSNIAPNVSVDVGDYVVNFDKNHLAQILINLIANAHRHGSLNGDSSVLVKAHTIEENLLAIDVIDHGNGVMDDDVQDLFQPFFTKSINGTGLGLYLSKNLCETNNSTISYIKSDIGACFRVSIQAWDTNL